MIMTQTNITLEQVYFESARIELNYRMNQREYWLKVQLFIQAVLLALYSGMKVQNIEILTSTSKQDLLTFPLLFSLIILYQHALHDKLVGYLSRYIKELTVQIQAGDICKLNSWETSSQFKAYTENRLFDRYLSLFFVFFILPTLLVALKYYNGGWEFSVEIVVQFGLAIWIFCKIFIIWLERKKLLASPTQENPSDTPTESKPS